MKENRESLQERMKTDSKMEIQWKVNETIEWKKLEKKMKKKRRKYQMHERNREGQW